MYEKNSVYYSGKLIAVEGLDGSGKSTQVYLLKRWLEDQNLKVFFTEWNSSLIVKKATSKGKKRQLLTPTTFSLIHATDFADRYERQVLPLLKGGYIVLADRYFYTAYVRDITRGCHKNWVKNLYNFAVPPDLTFYFKVPLEVALNRILAGRPKLKYFEAGMDLNYSTDIQSNFKIFQTNILKEYEKFNNELKFSTIDASLSIKDQQMQVREIVSQEIDLNLYKKQTSITRRT
ncbi:MAG: dTMP kinase [Candidatus Margulisiibacteriota bacterium]|jgi:dTMP kinase